MASTVEIEIEHEDDDTLDKMKVKINGNLITGNTSPIPDPNNKPPIGAILFFKGSTCVWFGGKLYCWP